jgi:LPS-assembly lipoprotein
MFNFVSRRGVLVSVAALAASGLSGCGFELRKAPVFAFKTIAVPGGSNMVRLLRRNLPLGGNVQVIPPEQKNEAEAILEILGENQERVVLSTNSSGQVREIQLRLHVNFRLITPGGKELLPSTEIQQFRDITYDESAALAKEAEEQLLFRDMQSDIVQQVLRRLAAVKSL